MSQLTFSDLWGLSSTINSGIITIPKSEFTYIGLDTYTSNLEALLGSIILNQYRTFVGYFSEDTDISNHLVDANNVKLLRDDWAIYNSLKIKTLARYFNGQLVWSIGYHFFDTVEIVKPTIANTANVLSFDAANVYIDTTVFDSNTTDIHNFIHWLTTQTFINMQAALELDSDTFTIQYNYNQYVFYRTIYAVRLKTTDTTVFDIDLLV